jgi:uncharacterized protein YndB with AHSA1/START domain
LHYYCIPDIYFGDILKSTEKFMENNHQDLIAKVSITIEAPTDEVWKALVDPDMIKRYIFGTQVLTDWEVGSPILWKGIWQGKTYQDKGKILKLEREQVLEYSHFSPLSGQPDLPENYHTVTIELSGQGAQTKVSLAQDNNPSEDDREHSEENWGMMLKTLKDLLES